MLLAALLCYGFERKLQIGVAALKGTGASVTAIAQEKTADFEWAEYRPYYSLSGRFFFRDYEDVYGTYSMAQVIGTGGNLEIVGGFIRFQIAAGAHISRLDGAYEYVDFVAGPRVFADYTFFLDRPWFVLDGAMLTEGKVLIAWAELRLYPHEQLAIGMRLDYDGDLDAWGDAPYLVDDWNNGMNLEITASWTLDI